MGFLDRFKKQKEQEVEKAVTAAPVSGEEKKVEKAVKPKEEKKEEKKKPVRGQTVPANLSDVIVGPVVSEKAATLASGNQYVFEVSVKANKVEIARAVKAAYGIAPAKVGIINSRREPVRFGRVRGKQKATKKAVVILPKGKSINVYEGV